MTFYSEGSKYNTLFLLLCVTSVIKCQQEFFSLIFCTEFPDKNTNCRTINMKTALPENYNILPHVTCLLISGYDKQYISTIYFFKKKGCKVFNTILASLFQNCILWFFFLFIKIIAYRTTINV